MRPQCRAGKWGSFFRSSPLPTHQEAVGLYGGQCGCNEGELHLVSDEEVNAGPFRQLMQRIAVQFYSGQMLAIDGSLLNLMATTLFGSVLKGWGLSNTDSIVGTPAAETVRKLRENVWVFSGFKTYYELKIVSDLITLPNGRRKPFQDFLNEVLKMNDQYNVNYLKAEYQYAVSSSKSAAKWQGYVDRKDSYVLQYRTQRDGRVRERHQRLDGLTRPVDDPVWDSIYPANGWRCRCFVVQVPKSRAQLTDAAKAMEDAELAMTEIGKDGKNRLQMFKINPGKDGVLFPENHPFYRVGPEEAARVREAAKRQGGF